MVLEEPNVSAINDSDSFTADMRNLIPRRDLQNSSLNRREVESGHDVKAVCKLQHNSSGAERCDGYTFEWFHG